MTVGSLTRPFPPVRVLLTLCSIFAYPPSSCLGFSLLPPRLTHRGHHGVTTFTSARLAGGCKQRQQQQHLLTATNEYGDDGFLISTLAQVTPENDIILSWEADVAEIIRNELAKRGDQEGRPYMVGLVGNPGSGKTTSCFALSGLLSDVGCLVMPFDGYHIPMHELQAQPSAIDLVYRRGAPDTFAPDRLQRDLHRIRHGAEETVSIPGFDHKLGDPQPDQHLFNRKEHRVVLCEGLYLLHDDGGVWKQTKNLFDFTIFVNVKIDICVERLKSRNQCIPGYTKEEMEVRCEVVDRVNAETVERSKVRADLVVDSAAQRSATTTTISDGAPESDMESS